METRAFAKIITQTTVAACALLLSSGCASSRKMPTSVSHPGDVPDGPTARPAVQGQEFGPPILPPEPKYGPDFQVQRPVVLVLGPGLARGYAYTGVIRALTEAKIKIGAIFGTEMGALIGSLYALDGSVNKLEWGVQRFRDDVFDTDGSVISKFLNRNPAEKLESSLEHVFNNHDVSETKILMRVLIQPAGAGAKVYDHGSLRGLVRAAMGNSNGFPPFEADGAPAGTAAAFRPFDVQDAKALGIGPVIVVDVLDPKESDLFPEMKEADLILQPDMRDISKTDFKKRTDAVFAGRAIARDHLDEIKKLIGGGNP